MTVIKDIIKNEKDSKKREILRELAKLNNIAYQVMMQPYKQFKQKYAELQKTIEWTRAKILLLEYLSIDDKIIKCDICNRIDVKNDFVLHHEKYDPAELFTPTNIKFIHDKCHQRIHYRKIKKS